MKLNMTLSAIVFMMSTSVFFAQDVSTLINDSTRDFEAMHWHPDGRIYSVDYNAGRVYRLYLDGSAETLVTGFTNLAGGGFDDEGNFYFSGIANGNLYRLNADNTYTQIASGLNQPVGVLQSSDPDTLFVIGYGNNSVSKVSISGGTTSSWVSNNGINGPDAIIYHESGDLLVANFNNNKIHRIDLDGNVSLFATLPSSGFMGYLCRSESYVYVPSLAGNKIFKIDMAGNIETLAGTGAPGNGDGEALAATFTDPNGIACNAAGDSILVADGKRIRLIKNLDIVNTVQEPIVGNLILSPNPAKDLLRISFELASSDTINWKVLNTKGQQILSDQLPDLSAGKNEVNLLLNKLPSGTYLLQLINSKGQSEQHLFVKL